MKAFWAVLVLAPLAVVPSAVWADPLTLDQAMALSVASSPDLRSLVIQQSTALDGYRWGFREYLPKLGLNSSQNEAVTLNSPDTRSLQMGVTVTQLVFDAGRLGRQRDLARLQLSAGSQDYREQEEQITDSVRTLFNQILVLKKKLAIQAQVVEVADRQLEISRKELDLGSAREVDVLDTEAQASSLKVDRKQSERSLREAFAQLANLLGIETKGLDIAGDFDEGYQGLDVPEENDRWLAEVLDTSKDIAQQRLDLRQQYFSLLNQNLWYLPNISVELTMSLTGTQYPLQTPAYNASVTFSFPGDTFPFTQKLDLGSTTGQTSSGLSGKLGIFDSTQGLVGAGAAKAQYEVSQLKSQILRSTVKFNFEKAIGDYKLLIEKLALQRNTVAIEEKKNAILAKQVELGEAKRVDYLQGETQLANDRIALIESVLQIKETERSLERMLHRAPGTLARAVQEVSP
jgi:outer membrane protein TolC